MSEVFTGNKKAREMLFRYFNLSPSIFCEARWCGRSLIVVILMAFGTQPSIVCAEEWYWTGVKFYDPPANPAEWGIYYPGHWSRRGYWPTLEESASKTCKAQPAGHRLSDDYKINWIKPAQSGVEFGLRAHMGCDWRNGLAEFYGLYFDKPCAEGERALHFQNGSIFCADIDYDAGRNLGAPRCESGQPYSPVGQGTNPINIATGNKYERVLVMPGQAHMPGFDFHYNSQRWSSYPRLKYREGGLSQQRWTHTFEGLADSTTLTELSTIVDPDELAAVDGALVQISVYLGDGRILRFENRFDANRRSTAKIDWDASDANVSYQLATLESPSGAVEGYRLKGAGGDYRDYDKAGIWRSWRRADGQVLTLEYTPANRVQRVSDAQGRTILFAYDQLGSLLSVTDSAGAVYGINLNESGDLLSIIFPDETPANDADNPQKVFLYEDASHPAHLTGVIDERGHRAATWIYDAQGRALSSEHADGTDRHTLVYNADGTTTVTDSLDQDRHYTFAVQHGLKVVTSVDGGACAECGGDAMAYSFDANGYLQSKIDHNGNVTTYVHGIDGLETSRTEASGTPQARTITTAWDTDLRKPTLIAEPGKTTAYTYNAPGQMKTRTVTDIATGETRTTTYTYNAQHLLEAVDGPRTDAVDVTQYTYDAAGNRATMTDGLGHLTQYTDYDDAGRLLRSVDPNGTETTYTYHPRGWVTSRTVAGATTSFDYDAVGNLVKLTLPSGTFLDFVYDAADRLKAITDAHGNQLEYALDSAGNRTAESVKDAGGQLRRTLSRIFNTLGQLHKEIGSDNQTTEYSYDANGNQNTIKDPLLRQTANVYDPLERLKQQVDPAGTIEYGYDAQDNLTMVAAPNGAVTTYEYNGFGEKTRQVSPDTGVTTFAYDEAGNLASRTDARGVTTTFSYDALNRLTGVIYPDASLNVSYEYDQGENGVGRLTTMRDAGGVSEYTYDARGNLLTDTRTASAVVTVIGYSYDEADRLSAVTYPSGRKVHYQYDTAGQVAQVSLEDSQGLRVLAGNVQHLPFGPVESLEYGNGLVLSRVFDQDYRLASQSIPGVLGASYGYDAVGNIKTWADTLDATRSQTFDYDDLDRLLAATGSISDFGYAYDAVGNRLTQTIGASTENYQFEPDSNRLAAITGAFTEAIATDPAGNITQSLRGDFIYSDANRLARFTSAGVDAIYTYNGRGERVRKVVNGITQRFRYDSTGRLLAELAPDGGVIREFVYMEHELIAMLIGENANAQGWAASEEQSMMRLDPLPGENAMGAMLLFAGPASMQIYMDTRKVDLEEIGQGRSLSLVVPIDAWQVSPDPLMPLVSFSVSVSDGGTLSVVTTATDTAASASVTRYVPPERKDEFDIAQVDGNHWQGALTADPTATASVLFQTDLGIAQFMSMDVSLQLSITKWCEIPASTGGIGGIGGIGGFGGGAVGGLSPCSFPGGQAGDTVFMASEGDHAVFGLLHQDGTGTLTYQKGVGVTTSYQMSPTTQTTVGLVYAHPDHLGSVAKLTDEAGAVVWDADREPFGAIGERLATVSMPLRFPGQYYDDESGLFYNYFRYYDPATGRYITSDPIGLAGGLNTYAYVEGNPLRYTDPLGLIKVCFFPAGVTHVGFGSDYEADTYGYYPSYRSPFSPGEVRPDPRNEPKECKTVPTDKRQDECMTSCRLKRQTMPGWYHMGGRNCTYFVRDCMRECNIPTGTSPLFDFWPQPFPRDFFDNLPGKPVTHP